MLRSCLLALNFLTTLKVPIKGAWEPQTVQQSVRAFPVVGFVIGLLLALFLAGLEHFDAGNALLRGVLTLNLWLLLTGALHLDGLCDVADGAFSSASIFKRRRIAQDPTLGVFAFAAGSAVLLTKAAALSDAALEQPFVLILPPLLSRTLVILPLAYGRVQKSSSLARTFRPSQKVALQGLSLGFLLCTALGLALVPGTYLVTVCTALTATLASWAWISRRLAGIGGDALGAIIEITETAVLLALAF